MLDALAEGALLDAIRTCWQEALGAARGALSVETESVGEAFLAALEGSFAHADTHVWCQALLQVGCPDRECGSEWSRATLDVDLARAVQRIALDPSWSSSIELQRWGMGLEDVDLRADWFPRGFIELGLSTIVGGRELRIHALLSEIPPGELRYFRGWRGIPPDADSLGIMLQLASELADPPHARLASWIRRMEENVGEDGVPPVWFRRSADGPTHDPPDRVWEGDACTASLLSLALGLVSFDGGRFTPVVTAIVRRALASFAGIRFSGTYYYPDAYATHLFILLVARLPAGAPLHDEAHRLRDAVVRSLASAQRLDGSWGSPQTTAWALEALCSAGPEPLAVARAARFLGDSQRGDGSWLPETLYRIAGKRGSLSGHQGIELTTVICARALAAARRVGC